MSWDQVESNRHWYNTSRTLRLFGTSAIAWLPVPASLVMQFFMSLYLVVAISVAWFVFWVVMARKGLTLSSLWDMLRRRLQGRELFASRTRSDEF